MRSFGRLAVVVACAALASVGATSAFAQVCGDADGNGSVTVTDGVQVLRSAAGLSSSCTDHASSCDVDGSGTVTVTDGVNVLRKAAGLSITEACPSGSKANTQDLADTVVPFLTLGLAELSNVSISSASVQAADTQDCEDGGTRTTSRQGLTTEVVTFAACRVSEQGLGSFQFDGTITAQFGIPNTGITFELSVTDLGRSKPAVDFDGTVQATPNGSGGFTINSGTLQVRGPNEGAVIFTVTIKDPLVVDGDGHVQSGSVEAEDTSNSFDLATAEFTVVSSTSATVHTVDDDGSTHDFTLDLRTGDLTPA